MTGNRHTVRAFSVAFGLLASLSLGISEPVAGAEQDRAFGNHSMRGSFAYAMDGSFASAPPPFIGDRENFRFSQVGRFHFDGAGSFKGEFSLAFQNAPSGGMYSTAIQTGSYQVTEDGRMIIQFQDFRGGLLINEGTLDCVIVQRRRLARCAMVELVSFQQGPNPVALPVTGLGTFQRQR